MALAMTYAGARNETSTEMAGVLRFPPLDPVRLHSAFGAVAEALRDMPGVELNVANAIFGEPDEGFLPDFLAVLKEHYGAALQTVTFSADAEQARETINRWVEQQTEGKIAQLIPPGILDCLTRLVLVNAIYFKGRWTRPFLQENTLNQPFFCLDRRTPTVPFMRGEGKYKLIDIEGGQMLGLPYKDGASSMVVILPTRKDGLLDMEAKVATHLPTWLHQLDGAEWREVEVYLPRFRIGARIRLDNVLKSLGITLAFDANAADFSGMNRRVDNLFIAAALHEAFVEVNEEGTTAGAATAVLMPLMGEPEPPPLFRANHPFVFLIRGTVAPTTSCVLFLGRLVEPNG